MMEHLQTIAVTLTSFAHQLNQQGFVKSRIETRLSPFISDVQSIVDLWCLQDSSRFSTHLLLPSYTKLQQKIAAELPYDRTTMTYPKYIIKSAVSSVVALVQYSLGTISIPGYVLTQLDFSVKESMDQVKKNRAGSVDEPDIIFQRIQDTLNEYQLIVAPAKINVTDLQTNASPSLDEIRTLSSRI